MKRKPHQPATAPARPAAAIEDRVVARPDGYYWVADDGKQEFGPFATVAEALAAANEAIAEQAQALHDAEAELGVPERLDQDIVEVDERVGDGEDASR